MQAMDPFAFSSEESESADDLSDSSSASSVDEEGTPYKLGTLAIPLNNIVDNIRKLNASINYFTVEQLNDLQSLKLQLQKHALQSQTNCASTIAVADLLIDNLKVFSTINELLETILKHIPNLDDKISEIIRYIHPPTFELFLKKHEFLLNKLRASESNATEVCSICTERPANTYIARNCESCQKSDTPVCRCTYCYCLDCLLKTFYIQSERQVRSYGTCPTCRSHFCLDDLVVVQIGEQDGSSDKKRALSDNSDSSPKRLKL